MSEIISAITDVGYPIVCSLILMYYISRKDDKYSESINKLSDVISGNTTAVTKLLERMESNER